MQPLRTPGAILVAMLWTAAFVAGLFNQDFVPLEVMTPVVLIVAGAIYVKNGRP